MIEKLTKSAAGVLCAVILLGLVIQYLKPARETFLPAQSRQIIIDAGHGGEDGGAVSISGVFESDINLSVALRLEQVLAFIGYDPIMTRRTAEIDYPAEAETIRQKKVYDQKTRAELINSTPNAVLISVHQNKYTSPSPSGAQVLYADTVDSESFAAAVETALGQTIGEESIRARKEISPDIYLMKNISCPAVLVECGFLSNPSDEARLLDSAYQTRLAIGMAAGCMEYIKANT